jgi:hypothetical protein
MSGTTVASATTVGVRLTTASQLPLSVTASGAITVTSGSAVYIAAPLLGAISNLGTVKSSAAAGLGIQALGAASIVNGASNATAALIEGGRAGVDISGAATLTNYGTVAATASASTPGFASVGAYLSHGGSVANGSSADTTAAINGASVGVAAFAAPLTLSNFGTIAGTGAAGRGVWLQQGGRITNGSATDTTAKITGAGLNAIYAAGAATVSNFGTVTGGRTGVELRAGGSVTNGSSSDTKATITGARYGVYISTYSGGAGPFTVTNFGRITGGTRAGVGLYGAATVSNGTATDTTAAISGRNGVYVEGVASVTNFGTISGSVDAAVALFDGGAITNGSATSTAAAIIGASGPAIYTTHAAATVTNFGRIAANGDGVVLQSGGTLVNGGAADTTATVSSKNDLGFYADGFASVTNYGTISNASNKHSAVNFYAGGTLVNGSTADTAALITSNRNGVYVTNSSVGITNFGTISGAQRNGIALTVNATVVNGSAADSTATINGKYNAIYAGSTATVTNYGTLTAAVYSAVNFYNDGGAITNYATGLIKANEGVYGRGAATTVTNFGSIDATLGAGVDLRASGNVTNGSSTNSAASITGNGHAVYADTAASATITNFGILSSSTFSVISLADGGTLVNETSGRIVGPTDVYSSGGAVTVTNLGTMIATGTTNSGSIVALQSPGTVVNGSTADTTALMSAKYGIDLAGGSVTNYGTVTAIANGVNAFGTVATTVINSGSITSTGTAGTGVFLGDGGFVTNGSSSNSKATISGPGQAINATTSVSATVTNFGTLSSTKFAVVLLQGGGALVNEATGQIDGAPGVFASAAATITNLGTIQAAQGSGINLAAGGSVVNGSSTDVSALIAGGSGVNLAGGSVNNFGSIAAVSTGVNGYGTVASSVTNLGSIRATGTGSSGVSLADDGSVTNGSSSNSKASISGGGAAIVTGTPTSSAVVNFGMLSSTSFAAVSLTGGGSLVNEASGVITGASGVFVVNATAAITNLGTIQATGTATQGSGIDLSNGGTVVNGSSTDAAALISSNFGLTINNGSVTNYGTISAANTAIDFTGTGTGTLTNAGTIESTSTASGAAAVSFNDGSATAIPRFIDDPGSVVVGVVYGSANFNSVLELAAGAKAGSISGISTSVGGSFENFGTLQVDAGATWTLGGNDSIGTLADSGVLTVTGSLAVTGSINPADAGTIDLGTTATLSVGNVFGSGPSIAFLGTDLLIVTGPPSFGLNIDKPTYIGPLLEQFGTSDKIDLLGIAPAQPGVSLVLNYSTSTGILQISSPSAGAPPLASLAFQTGSLGAGTFHLASDGHGGEFLTHS